MKGLGYKMEQATAQFFAYADRDQDGLVSVSDMYQIMLDHPHMSGQVNSLLPVFSKFPPNQSVNLFQFSTALRVLMKETESVPAQVSSKLNIRPHAEQSQFQNQIQQAQLLQQQQQMQVTICVIEEIERTSSTRLESYFPCSKCCCNNNSTSHTSSSTLLCSNSSSTKSSPCSRLRRQRARLFRLLPLKAPRSSRPS